MAPSISLVYPMFNEAACFPLYFLERFEPPLQLVKLLHDRAGRLRIIPEISSSRPLLDLGDAGLLARYVKDTPLAHRYALSAL